MRDVAVIRLLEDRLAWYPPGASDGPQWLDDEAVAQQFHAALTQRTLTPVFAVPAADLHLLRLQVAPEERRHLDKSLPFSLEEELAEDISALHFAHCPLGDLDFAVAVCAREHMQRYAQALAGYPPITQWLPEPLLLPWQEGEWCLVLEAAQAVVRTGACTGFGAERAMLPALLQAQQHSSGAPDTIIIYGTDQQADTALLPEALQERVQWRRGDLYSALLLAETTEPSLNLRQGEWASRLPLRRWWQQWRKVAVLFAVAVALHMVSSWMDYRQLKQENLALRGAVEESYRTAFPRGAISDAEKQLRRQLDTLSGTSHSSGFISMLGRVGAVIEQGKGSIVSINYNDKAAQMRLNLVAANYEAVEKIRAGFAEQGLEATLENSSAQGDQVRARLRVGERS